MCVCVCVCVYVHYKYICSLRGQKSTCIRQEDFPNNENNEKSKYRNEKW